MSVVEAVRDLRQELEAGEKPETALKFIAEEYGLNPLLLERKFAESYGSTLTTYNPTPLPSAQPLSQVAVEEAERWKKAYVDTPRFFGKRFRWEGEEFIFVAYQAGSPTWAVKAVRMKDAARRQFTVSCWNQIYPQLKA